MSSSSAQTSPETSRYASRLPRDQRRQQILDAALPEFIEKGFVGAHVSAIAEAIGVSKPVIYSIFPGKDELATAVVEEAHRLEAVDHVAYGAVEAYPLVAEGKVTPLLNAAFEVAAGNRTLSRFLYSDYRGAPQSAIRFHDDVFEARTEGLRHYLMRYFAGRPDAEALVWRTSEVISVTSRFGLAKVSVDESCDPEELARHYGSILEGGIQSV